MSRVDVAALEDLAPGTAVRVEVEGTPICLVNTGEQVRAVHDTCTHARESLSAGWVDEGRIECPRHGALFDLATGEAVTPPATLPLPTYAVEVRDGRVLVDPTPSHAHPLDARRA
jgi:3-phenylpropionate/trans-cinnamate dioxygenase ferredoxin subunit